MTTKPLFTAGALIIRDRKLLLAYSNRKECYYLPGGKRDTGETAETALLRELQEELGLQLTETDLQFETHVTAPAYGETNDTIMEQDCFLVLPPVEPHPAAEIGAIRYFRLMDYFLETHQAPGAIQILTYLKQKGSID